MPWNSPLALASRMRQLTAMNQIARSSAPIPIVSSIAPLVPTADAWLVDIWGVMHNGLKPFVPACDACRAFRAAGGTVLLLSNAPRPAASVVSQLRRIGVPDDAYDRVLSSGDAARNMIAVYAGRAVFHLGPERDLPLFDGTGVELAPLERAEAVVCTGLYDDETETPDTYTGLLTELRARDLAMVCANPDLKVERGGRIIWCAGGVAAAYEALGGDVAYAGKPHAPIYTMADGVIAELRGGVRVPRDRILAIGDGVKTDIKGASDAGIRSVYVASGVHLAPGATLDGAALGRLFDRFEMRPVAAMQQLAL